MKPATPGFLVTLIATVLLAIVSFSVPWFKSVYFLKASLSVQGINGSITFGVLGYCLELNNGTTCSKAAIGYQLDINALLGNSTKVQIPEVLVKWITYALVLHIVALVLAAISAVFGLLAHVREFSMSCLSTCISGVGASVALLAFVFDIVLFFLVKSRINSVTGGSATMGNAIWLTLIAWVLLFFSGCFYGLGRCCIRRRPRDMTPRDGGGWMPSQSTGPTYEDQMRLDAVKAEADRKARQQKGELGLPSFPEYDPTQPLTADAEHEPASRVPYRDAQYAAAPVGTRAVDEYYASGNSAYPPRRQPTTSSAYTQSTQRTAYAPSTYEVAAAVSTGPPVSGGYFNTGNTGYQDSQYPSQASAGYVQDATNANYRRPSAHSYNSPHAQAVSDTDPFRAYATPQAQQTFDPTTYNTSARFSPPPLPSSTQPYGSAAEQTASYYTPQVQTASPPPQTRSTTLGGGGYGDSSVPALQDPRLSEASSYLPYPGDAGAHSSSGGAYLGSTSPTGPRGPRDPAPGTMLSPVEYEYEDSPPMYDDNVVTGGIGTGHPAPSGKR